MRERKMWPHAGLLAAAAMLPLVAVDPNDRDDDAKPRRDGGCKYCGRKFKTTAGYESHLARYHEK